MTKWIKLQSGVGSRAAERTRRGGGGGDGDGGRDKRREEKERQVVLKDPPVFALQTAFSLMLFINSPPSGPVQSSRTPKHHPGLYAVMSQLALEESAVGGLSLPIQPRLLSGKNASCMLGAKEDTHHEYRTQTMLQGVQIWADLVGRQSQSNLFGIQLINHRQSSLSPSSSRPC